MFSHFKSEIVPGRNSPVCQALPAINDAREPEARGAMQHQGLK